MPHAPPPSVSVGASTLPFREFVLLCACLMAMNALSIDPMLPAFPDIARDLRIPHPNDRQLIISLYFIGLSVGSLLFGVLSDRFGRKRVMGSAMVAFILSSIACAGAHSFPMLLAGRVCAGFFAGASRVITVGIVRDCFRGDSMARVMSLIMAVFMIIPVLAPSFGQAVLWIAPWRWIFWILAIFATFILGWMLMRMPETLPRENRLPIGPASVLASAKRVFTIRTSIGYMLASGFIMSGLMSFIASVQQILFDSFNAGRIFPIAFAAMAGCMGLGSLANSRLVSRFGARRMSQGALCMMILTATTHLLIIMRGHESLVSFMLLQGLAMLAISFTGANFSAIAMEPFRKGAGAASSFQTFLTTSMSAVLGGMVGRAYDGTALPLALGSVCFGLAALAMLFWAERGRLFTRPHNDTLREVEFEPIH